MNLRTLAYRVTGVQGDAPSGATHVLAYVPPDSLEPSNDAGLWEMWTLRRYRSGKQRDLCEGLDAPSGLGADEAAEFAAEVLGHPAKVVPFRDEISLDGDSDWRTVPCYYVIPSGGR